MGVAKVFAKINTTPVGTGKISVVQRLLPRRSILVRRYLYYQIGPGWEEATTYARILDAPYWSTGKRGRRIGIECVSSESGPRFTRKIRRLSTRATTYLDANCMLTAAMRDSTGSHYVRFLYASARNVRRRRDIVDGHFGRPDEKTKAFHKIRSD